MATLRDVARASGVSVMTVSNVVNGRPSVGEATRRRVLDAIADLGYEANLAARRLRVGRTGTIALVVPRIDHPYFGELAARFTDALRPAGRHLVLEQSGASKEGELGALSQARLQQYDGVLLSAVGLQHADVDRLDGGVPLVLLGEKPMPPRFDHVSLGNREGGRLATAHLLARGARRVLMLGGTTGPTDGGMSDLRAQGWRDAHEDAGVEADPALVVPLAELEMGHARQVVRRLVAEGPAFDAVLAVTDQVAIGVLAGLRDAGLRVPQDVQVAGFDNLAVGEHVGPGLTTVDPGNDVLVSHALRLLDRRLAGEAADAEHVVTPVRLVERGTTR
ncbi:LacI family DNA-binding transcriptional regulator [Cellulomonas sp. JZ18]|uniref:LacI family DNA-binding transcriptional regulator n=1 Tax=Cellulomonas sp. JZ18 TaxID=2654191 RepID=UPI0012D4940B|nr:LacI family DNA-binding transcriptional regulator [Cellulomonas sp. JZ18]QGQ20724.1 LacI family DNA-binding transcriptional regulator [Cellulomonas sp. JZ18]